MFSVARVSATISESFGLAVSVLLVFFLGQVRDHKSEVMFIRINLLIFRLAFNRGGLIMISGLCPGPKNNCFGAAFLCFFFFFLTGCFYGLCL